MIYIKDVHDKRTFELIVGYIAAGGDVTNPWIIRFLSKIKVTTQEVRDLIEARSEPKSQY